MRRLVMALSMFLSVLAALPAVAQSPYSQPLKPTGVTLQAVALPARSIGQTVMRAKSTLAVAVQVAVEDYLPRGLEPTLLIDGVPAKTAGSGVVGMEGRVTTLSFVLDSPALLKDGAELAIQMGDDARTRAAVPGRLRRQGIQPLDQSETQRRGLPTLDEWLSRPSN